ncbi:MAG: ABC transporter ATP-binding protein/permease [Anaerolineae bacterium]|nr:ABC transporter ATP-binding protein/permease [Anaerolineae bacterium]
MFLGLNAESYDRTYTDATLVRRLASYYLPQRRRMLALVSVILGITAIGFFDPVVVSRTLDILRLEVAQNAPTGEMTSTIGWLIAFLLAVAVLNWLGNFARRRLTARLISDVISALRRDAFNAVIRHDLSFFDKYQSGKIISRISGDTQELAQVSTLLADLVTQFAILIVLTTYLFSVSWQMALTLLGMAPVVVIMGVLFRRGARRVTRSGFRAVGEVNSSIQEMVAGMCIAKNFRQEASMYRAFQKVNDQAYTVNLRRGVVMSNIFPTLNAFEGIGTAVLAYVGGQLVGAGSLSVGVWYLFIISLSRFWFPLTNLASFWSQIQSGLSACERVFSLIDAEPSVRQDLRAKSQEPRSKSQELRGEIQAFSTQDLGLSTQNSALTGAVAFERVNFSYVTGQAVLAEFSLKIAPGESVALVGHTGAGKSSIVKLISRFYEFQSGQILLDGRDIRGFDLAALRSQLGIVSQVPFLFAGSIADNIRYAKPDLSDAEVEAIARRIGDGEWLDSLPVRMRTEVGERGGRLSLGQRQLVALGRVLAQRPPIFMLDEATASVDPFTERQIQTALNLILKSSTSILIAHRLSTVKAVDRILVLDHGRIIEEGNHDNLMQRGGHYAALYDTYFRHQSADFKVKI